MLRFVLRRLQIALLVAVTVSIVGFSLLRASGDIALVLAGENAKPEEVVRISHAYGLDKPLYMQYLDWGGKALSGDLGRSLFTNEPVTGLILDRLPVTIYVAVPALIISLLIAVPLGVLAATRPNTWIDRAALSFAVTGSALPSFWLALMLILVFAVALGWFPAGGLTTIGDGGIVDRVQHLVLPVATLTLASIGGYTRFMRAAMAEALRQDFVRTARAKGAGERRVVLHHALRNAMIPVVTIVALSFGTLFSGALITETMFAYPGMGKLIFDSVMGNDYNLALAGLLFATLVTLLANLVADVAYAWLDPRITYR